MSQLSNKSTKPFKVVSYRARMSEESDSRKDSHPTKLKQRSKVLVKLSFTVLCYSKFSGLQNFDNSHFIESKKKVNNGKGKL